MPFVSDTFIENALSYWKILKKYIVYGKQQSASQPASYSYPIHPSPAVFPFDMIFLWKASKERRIYPSDLAQSHRKSCLFSCWQGSITTPAHHAPPNEFTFNKPPSSGLWFGSFILHLVIISKPIHNKRIKYIYKQKVSLLCKGNLTDRPFVCH